MNEESKIKDYVLPDTIDEEYFNGLFVDQSVPYVRDSIHDSSRTNRYNVFASGAPLNSNLCLNYVELGLKNVPIFNMEYLKKYKSLFFYRIDNADDENAYKFNFSLVSSVLSIIRNNLDLLTDKTIDPDQSRKILDSYISAVKFISEPLELLCDNIEKNDLFGTDLNIKKMKKNILKNQSKLAKLNSYMMNKDFFQLSNFDTLMVNILRFTKSVKKAL